MNALKLKDGSYLLSDAKHRYQLMNSRSTDAKPGIYVLPDDTKLHLDQNGRCFKVENATQQPIRVEDVSPIKRKMAAIKEPASKTQMQDPRKTYSPAEALELQKKERLAERLKKYERLKKRPRTDAIAKQPDKFRFR